MSGEIAVFSVIGIGLVGAVMAVLLRQYRPEFAMLVTLAVAVGIFALSLRWLLPVLEQVQSLLDRMLDFSEPAAVLLRTVGICFITQTACALCRDAGENAIASHMESAGKIAMLLTTLPLFRQILELILALLGI